MNWLGEKLEGCVPIVVAAEPREGSAVLAVEPRGPVESGVSAELLGLLELLARDG